MTTLATLIGDVVDSRSAPDREALHTRLITAIDLVNELTAPVHPVRVTVGDEFQGAWHRRGQALHAALTLRLTLLPEVETRYGLGHGRVTSLSADDSVQDGPGWWAAREAITRAKGAEERARTDTRIVRTRWHEETSQSVALDAVVRHRDLLLAALDDRSRRLLRGLLHGATQRELAEAEDISIAAVNRRVHRDALDELVALDHELRELP